MYSRLLFLFNRCSIVINIMAHLLAHGVKGVGLSILIVVDLLIPRQGAKRPLRASVGHPRHDLIVDIAFNLPLLEQLLNLLIVEPIINM